MTALAALAAKLGITADSRVLVVGPAPDDVREQLVDPGDGHHQRPANTPYDVIVAFNLDRRTLDRHAAKLPDHLAVAGGLWLCWPKKSSGVATDVGEADVRSVGLGSGLVDNKVAAIDPTWSALRFVRRLADR
jgi:hypothetical protein